MITPEVIARINELGRKQKADGLTEAERAEQATLRRMYIDNIKAQVKHHLDGVKPQPPSPSHSDDCGCGCHHKH